MNQVDYDKLASRYDEETLRAKEADADLLACANALGEGISALDIGCGTGSQQLANQKALPQAQFAGVDPYHGMLKRAQSKSNRIHWIQARAEVLPLPCSEFDYASMQFCHHHFENLEAALGEALRVLKPGALFVLKNICPQEMLDWEYYRFFPGAREFDLKAFPEPGKLAGILESVGFQPEGPSFMRLKGTQRVSNFLVHCRKRYSPSQLVKLSDQEFDAGIQKLEKLSKEDPDQELST